MKKILVLFAILSCYGWAFAQYDNVEKQIPANLDVQDVIACPNGYYLLTIVNDKEQVGQVINNYYTSKLIFMDRNLQPSWEKTFERGESPNLITMKLVGNQILIAGTSNDSKYADIKAWLVCTDLNGRLKWERKFSFLGQLIVEGKGIYPTNNGEFILHGHAYLKENSLGKPVLYRLNANGEIVWQRMYGQGYFYPDFQSGGFTSEGDLLFSGFVYPDVQSFKQSNKFDGFAAKIDAKNGTVVWEKRFQGAGYTVMNSFAETTSGEFLVVGANGDNCIARKAYQWILAPDGRVLQEATIASNSKTSIEHLQPFGDSGQFVGTGIAEKNTGGKSNSATLLAVYDANLQMIDFLEIDAENALKLRSDYDGTPIALGKKGLLIIQ